MAKWAIQNNSEVLAAARIRWKNENNSTWVNFNSFTLIKCTFPSYFQSSFLSVYFLEILKNQLNIFKMITTTSNDFRIATFRKTNFCNEYLKNVSISFIAKHYTNLSYGISKIMIKTIGKVLDYLIVFYVWIFYASAEKPKFL